MLNYRITGSRDRPCLILLHGFMGTHSEWTPLLSRLDPLFCCITLDLPGHGESPPPLEWRESPMETVCEAVFAVLDHLGISSACIWGYSLGGRVAMNMMLRRPGFFRAAVIESANPGIRDETARKERAQMDDRLAERLQAEGLPRFLDYWYRLPIFGSLKNGPAMSMLLQQRLRNDPDQLAEILKRLSPGRTPCLWDALAVSDLPPILFVSGEEDTKYCDIGARLAGENTRIRFERMAGCGHSIHIQQPAALARMALEFLEKVEESHD